MHTAKLDSVVGSTPRSLTPRWDAHYGVFRESWYPRLRSMMHTTESDSKMSVFVFFYLIRLSTSFFQKTYKLSFIQKTYKLKKITGTICDLQYQFHINIFRHHR